MKFCVFGAGRMGAIHARNIAATDRATLGYIVDTSLERANTLANKYGAIASIDCKNVLADPSVNAVIIASATDTHADLIEASVRANKAIICEKPIDLSLERVRMCERAIAGFDKPVMIGFQRRFDTTHRAVRQAIEQGEIGAVESISITSRDPSPPTYEYIKTSGGQFFDQMIHDFDLALWMSGASGKAKVFAMGAALIDPVIGELGDTDSAHVLIELETGAFCKIECSRRSNYGYDQRVEVFGASGMVSSNNLHTSAIDRWTMRGTGIRSMLQPDFMERYLPCYATELSVFIDAIENGTPIEPNFVAGRRALQLAEAAHQSKMSGLSVDVNLA